MKLGYLGLVLFLTSCATTISGTLVSTEGNNTTFKSGKVNILSLDNQSPSQVVDVAPNGEFTSKEPLENGTYLIEALVPGFKATSEKIRITESKIVTLKLVPIAADTQVIGVNSNLELGRGEGGAKITPPEM